MYNISMINGNVFQNYFNVNNSYTSSSIIASTSVTASSFSISAIEDGYKTYSYYNKYLKNDSICQYYISYSGNKVFTLYNRNQNVSFSNPDLVKSISANNFNVRRSITGQGYQYILHSTSGFLGWFFPFQRSFILKNELSTSAISVNQVVSYYLAQSSFYGRVLDGQRNNSYNCITRVAYNSATANQFIKGKPTYITTMALMDDDRNVLAIGKFSRAIEKVNFIPMSFKLRFFS